MKAISVLVFLMISDISYGGKVRTLYTTVGDADSIGPRAVVIKKGHNAHKRQAIPECTDGYENIPGSTMCLLDSPYFIQGSNGISEQDKQMILDEHNANRQAVNPTAKYMMKMYWDDELARLAEKWAKQCIVDHDAVRYIPKYGTDPGQNGAFGFSDWAGALNGWHEEVHMYRFGEDPNVYLNDPHGWLRVGHYSTIVQGHSTLIGCGFAKCQNSMYGNHYFCDYLTKQYSISNPYTDGESCSECPNSCNNKLCDCHGKYCFNEGILDPDSCDCECKFPWTGPTCEFDPCPGIRCQHNGILDISKCVCDCEYPYTGTTCNQKDCKDVLDPGQCGTQWDVSFCTLYFDVEAVCPVMCGVCPAPCSGLTCQNEGTLDINTCKCSCKYPYDGDSCELKKCHSNPDPYYCGTTWPKEFCTLYGNVKWDCPIMCEVCSAPCHGLSCQNSGVFDQASCSCDCKYPYTGESCEIKSCQPNEDPSYCGTSWPKSFCDIYWNVPWDCPVMCDVCPAPCVNKVCQNGGELDTYTCNCECVAPYTGELCEIAPCEGKTCKNRGNLNMNTCNCDCVDNWKGATCETYECPSGEPYYCGDGWPSSYCGIYVNVPDVCPKMCNNPRCP